jgi:alpha-L-rhamnosidase
VEKPEFEALWKAAAKTVKVCTSDAYTDNYRERRQYAQTAWYACLGNYAVFGDTALQRRYLVQIAQEQLANGIMPAYAPRHGSDFMVILDSNFFWVRGLHQYLLYSGDEQTVQELLPAARRLLRLMDSYTNLSGLIDSPPYPYWLDHALQDRRGANFCLNAHYLGALEDFAALLEWLGEPDSELYAVRGTRMREGLKKFWDEDKQLFADAMVDGQCSSLFSEHAQAMALAMKIATPEQSAALAGRVLESGTGNFIKYDDGMTMVTPAMSYFLHAGLCETGYTDESLDLLYERFAHMLEPQKNGTLWEEWWLDGTGRSGSFRPFPQGRSDAQTESSFPPALFTRYLLGIEPVEPGMRKVLIHPVSSKLECKGAIPTPSGLLEVEWKGSEVAVKAPDGIEVVLAPDGAESTILRVLK